MIPFDTTGAFKPTVKGVRRLALQGAAAMILSSGLGLAIQIVSTVVLARILTPRDFGLVAMVTSFSLLFLNFGLNGFSEAVAQWDDMTHSRASNLFWINTSAGVLLTVVFAASGTLLARFYHNPLVARVTFAISLTIFFTSLSVLHLALLKRAMRFPLVSANDLFSRGSALVLTIVFAWQGWGYWALVMGGVSQAVISCTGAWILCRWIPGLPHREAGTASIVRFALHVYGRFSVNYLTGNLDNVLVGWRFNAQSLGYYKKAFDLFALPGTVFSSSLTVVAVTALTRFRKDPNQFKRYLLGAMAVSAFLGMGIAGDLTLIGNDFIRLLLGPAWAPAGRIFTFFAPGIGVMILYGTHGWIHLSIGKADRWLRWGIVEFAVTVVLFIIGIHWGPAGMALAWTTSLWALVVPAIWYAGAPINLRVSSMIFAVWRYILAAALAGGASSLIIQHGGVSSVGPNTITAVIRIAEISVLFGFLYLSAIVLLYRGFSPLYQVGRLLREMLPFNRFSKTEQNRVEPSGANVTETIAP